MFMIMKKSMRSLILIIVFMVGALRGAVVEDREEKNINRFKKKVYSLFNHKMIIIAPIVAFVVYSIIQGDIPCVDIPQELLEYFDPTIWSNYFTSSSEMIVNSGAVAVEASNELINSQATQIKLLLETLSSKELKAIIDVIPKSILEKIPELAILTEKMLEGVNRVSDAEISGLIESIKECVATMKASGQTLSSDEYFKLFGVYLRHYTLIDQLQALII